MILLAVQPALILLQATHTAQLYLEGLQVIL